MLFCVEVTFYEMIRECSSCLLLSVLSRPVRCVLSYPPCLDMFVLPRFVSSYPSCVAQSACVMQWLSMRCFEMFVMSFPVCLVSSCPFCLVLSVLLRRFRLASSCLALSVLSRLVRLVSSRR